MRVRPLAVAAASFLWMATVALGGLAHGWFPERASTTLMAASRTEAWLARIDAAPGRAACGLARMVEPHLDAVAPAVRERHLARWVARRDSSELAAFGRWLRREGPFAGPHAGHVGTWLVCSTPAGEAPRGPVREGAPCFTGGHERLWTRVLSDADSGLLWLDDHVVTTAADRQELLHVLSLDPIPDAARTVRLGAAAAAIEVSVLTERPRGSELADGPATVTQSWRAAMLEHAPFDQLILPLEPEPAADPAHRGRRWVWLQIQPSSEQATRVRLRFDTSRETGPGDAGGPPEDLVDLARPAPLTPPAHPCRPEQQPWQGPVLDRVMGLPDGRVRPEDALLALRGTEQGLDTALFALPALRRAGARQAVLGHLEGLVPRELLGTLLLAAAHVSLDRAEPERARLLFDRAARETESNGVDPALVSIVEAHLALAEGAPERAYDLMRAACPERAHCPPRQVLLLGRAMLADGRDRELRALLGDGPTDAPEHPGITALRMSLASDEQYAEADAKRAVSRAARSPSRARLAFDAARWVARHTGRKAALGVIEPWTGANPRQLLALAVRNELAELLESLGDQAAAARIATGTLRLDPNDVGARRLVERFRPDEGTATPSDTMSENAPEGVFPSANDTSERARWRAYPVQSTSGGWEILEEHVWVRVAPDGSSTRVARRVLRADASAGSSLQRTPWRWTFDPSRVALRMLTARIHRIEAMRGGSPATPLVLPLRGIRTEERPPDSALVYYDEHALIIPIDAALPGDIVELAWVVEPTGHFFPGHFELLEPLQLHMFRHRYALTLDAPPNLTLHQRLLPTARPAPPAPSPAVTPPALLHDGYLRHALLLGPTPAIPSEAFAPPIPEIAATYQVTTLADDAALGRFWADLVRPQAIVTGPMREAVTPFVAAARTKGGTIDTARAARTIAGLVSERIRYVGLEFGIHGYKPYRTDDVWGRRFGDCKDQALMLVTLLREAGIAADPVLVRTRRLGRLRRDGVEPLPMLAAFDHAIVYIRERHHFVDPTALHHGYDTLHPDNQGADALIVPLDGRSAQRLELPRDPASRNGVRGDFGVLLNPDGSAHVTGRLRYLGIQAGGWRAQLADEARRTQQVQMMVGARFPGFELQRFDVEGLDADAPYLKLTFEGRVARLAEIEGDRLEVRDPLPLGGQRGRLGEVNRRMLPLKLGTPSSGQFEVQWTLPLGWKAETLPPNLAEDLPAMRTRVGWEQTRLDDAEINETLTGLVELSFLVDRVEPEGLSSLAAGLARFDSAVARPLVARRRADGDRPTQGVR
jgi:hypothetical protein